MTGFLAVLLSINSVWVYQEHQDVYFKSLFFLFYPEEMVMEPFLTDAEPELADRAEEYAETWSTFQTGLDFSECEFWVDSITMQKKAGIERGMVSLLQHPHADSLALLYVSEAPAHYEWEGNSCVIGSETTHAMSYLRRNPETPLKPCLLLLLMHRLMAQEECMVHFENIPSDSVAALYDSIYAEALEHPDPLVRFFAEEMDDTETVYVLN